MNTRLVFGVLMAALLGSGNLLAADGDVDLSFGSSGGTRVEFELGGAGDDLNDDIPQRLKVLSDGGLLLLGSTQTYVGEDLAAARLTQDGTLLGSFGVGGKFVHMSQFDQIARDVVELQNNDLLFAGSSDQWVNGVLHTSARVVRINHAGMMIHELQQPAADGVKTNALAAALFDDDVVIVGGHTQGASKSAFGLRYVAADASWDSQFGIDGSFIKNLGSGSDWLAGLVPTKNGFVAIAPVESPSGQLANSAIGVLELDPDFQEFSVSAYDFDASATKLSDVPHRIVQDAEGRYLILGKTAGPGLDSDLLVLRLLPNLTVDTSFCPSGPLCRNHARIVDLDGTAPEKNDQPGGIAVARDGKILLCGTHHTEIAANPTRAVLMRLTDAGFNDGSFANNGRLVMDMVPTERCADVAIQHGHGRIVSALEIEGADGPDSDFLVIAATMTEEADLDFKLSAPLNVARGAEILWTVTGENNGPYVAEDLELTVNFPAGTEFVSTRSPGWTCVGSANSAVCTGSRMSNDSTATLEIVSSAPATAGKHTATCSITATQPDPTPDDGTCWVATNVLDVVTSKTADPGPDSYVLPGDEIEYTIAVTRGPNYTFGGFSLSISDPIPEGTTYKNGSASGPGANFDPLKNKVLFLLDPNFQGTVLLKFRVVVDAGVTLAEIDNSHQVLSMPVCLSTPCVSTPVDLDVDGTVGPLDPCPTDANDGCVPPQCPTPQDDFDDDDICNDDDVCPFNPDPNCVDGGGVDDDDDDDGIPNGDDPCPQNPDPNCSDADGDGTVDEDDACPADPLNDADDDGICGDVDACPFNPDPACTSGGGADGDDDNDGIPNGVDPCPLNPDPNCTDGTDTDGDGTPNPDDVCPNDPLNDADDDSICGDVDACPFNPDPECGSGGGASGDDDNDGIPNGTDPCPLNPDPNCGASDGDTDDDGTGDDVDACPLDPNNDADDDGVCGNVDACPYNPDPTCTGGGDENGDDDDDGIPNGDDICPLVPGTVCNANAIFKNGFE
jgi:uncharacterized delta-60 repeat protein/uncharacterized repeat protein (TIGR01451 family)